jgi:gliding motility-associated-like protein
MSVLVKVGNLIFIPNSFTPDEDNLNDVFTPKGTGISEFSMLIYNRWGELIFETNDIDIGWDGTDYKRQVVPNGVYLYKIDYRFFTGERETKTGSVTLIR